MCLDDAGARQVGGPGGAGAESFGLEGTADGRMDGSMCGMALGCSGCAEAGYCRRRLDQEPLASAYMGPGVQVEAC